ncbi:hypothetical protein VC83_04796 [Pseudogymnoascus destructans]|uniref:Pentatricopeptide repeat protein n=2 Tax=Pseudogymnoascus destructans TaxID=655981 RepID=L8GBB0_PSED2|nr:uncharacterized protein VC83_04796 [Pseudogymnoascus destructans]ELR10500.1 hypothetical protein GMDG_04778 [Pseudogymnoascus destructans 20631-21]OAF57283.1 hypothetical protein VC83_04796 [Pseudogymnoascus destructans]
MPPLRPPISALGRGYVCPSCITKLQHPRYFPSSVRTISSRRNNPPQKTPITTKPEQPRLNKETVSFRQFEQDEHGRVAPLNTREDDNILEGLDLKQKDHEDELARLSESVKGSHEGTLEDKLKFVDSLRRAVGKHLGEELKAPAIESSATIDSSGTRIAKPSRGKQKRQAAAIEPIEVADVDVSIPRHSFPREGQAYISRLNESLEKALTAPFKNRKELWRWYSLSRKTLCAAWGEVPMSTWKLLWKELSVEALDNPDRMAHVIQLGNDMEAANRPLKPEQILLYIEAIFVEGNQKDALARWESARSSLTLVEATAIQYWALGVVMLATSKQPARAQEAADVLLNDLKAVKESRALITLIRTWSEYPDSSAIQMAWALYVRLKFWMGSSMKMQDYDAVAGIFITSNRTDLALAVFRDMMLTDDPVAKSYDSLALYPRFVGLKGTRPLESFQLGPEETSWTRSNPLTVLPPKFRNKFFFGSWIKKLVGDDEIDWASQVVELMSQRDIRPDATYLNGIIGAWFRTGSAENQKKGTTMAWKMIAARLEFVRYRSHRYTSNLEGPVRARFDQTSKDDFIRPSSIAVSAQASLETFSVLIHHYQQLGQKDRVQELLGAIKAAEIKPNTAFLNSLLELGTAMHHRPWVWSLYVRFVEQERVVPSQYTFALLWKSMKDHVDPLINRSKAGYPSPRFLFAEMNKSSTWKNEKLAREMYDQIILCFGLADDQIGTAVALRAMQRLYGMYPNEATVRSIVLQIAKAGVKNVAGYRPRRLNLNKDTQRRISDVGKVLKTLKDDRTKQLQDQGIDVEAMSKEDKSEESLKLLCLLLRSTMEVRMASEASELRMEAGVGGVDYLARSAAQEMGVPENLPWVP